MPENDRRAARLAALSLLGFVMLNYPLLRLFDAAGGPFGAPAPAAYLFAAWAGLIVLAAVLRR